jgi:hypothetical protein
VGSGHPIIFFLLTDDPREASPFNGHPCYTKQPDLYLSDYYFDEDGTQQKKDDEVFYSEKARELS